MLTEVHADEMADGLLVEICSSLGCPELFESIARMTYAFEEVREILDFVPLDAAARVSEMTVSGKLRDGVITFNPGLTKADPVRALPGQIKTLPLDGGSGFSVRVDLARRESEGKGLAAKSDSSPAKEPGATTVVAGMPDHTVAVPEPQAVVTPSATPVFNLREKLGSE